jgi:hypothetical protein
MLGNNITLSGKLRGASLHRFHTLKFTCLFVSVGPRVSDFSSITRTFGMMEFYSRRAYEEIEYGHYL